MSYKAIQDVTIKGIPAVIVRAKCDMCKADSRFTIPETEWLAWTQGDQHIQNAIKSLSEDDRELLISGTCGKCFNQLFSEDA